MIRSVSLHELPESLHFPPELQERIAYNAEKRQLEFDGYMSKTHFDKLIHLHKNDAYRRAIEHLFQVCEFEFEDTARAPRRKIVPITVAVLVLATCLCSLFILRR